MDLSPKSDLLPRSEWVLEGDDSYAHVYFEYCREIEELPAMLATWCCHFPSSEPFPTSRQVAELCDPERELSGSEILLKIYDSPMRIVLVCPQFPRRPWLEVPEGLRQKGLQTIGWAQIEEGLRRLKTSGIRYDFSKLTFDKFDIGDWARADDALIEEFKKWLREKRPCEPNRKPGRIAASADLLQALSVYRLGKHAKEKRGAQCRIMEMAQPPSPSQVCIARKKVRAFLAELSAPYADEC